MKQREELLKRGSNQKYFDDMTEYLSDPIWFEDDRVMRRMSEDTIEISHLTRRFKIPESKVDEIIRHHLIYRFSIEPGWDSSRDRISKLDFYFIAVKYGNFPDY